MIEAVGEFGPDSHIGYQNEMLDNAAPCVYDYARRAGPGGRERGHAHGYSCATINRKSPDQAEQNL